MKKILVVDDSPVVRQQVRIALGSAGFEVIEAGDGLDAVEQLTRHTPAVVICDVNMPRMDGIELLEHVAADPRWRDVPFVMLTTVSSSSSVERAKRAGAKGWMVKPFKADLLTAATRRLAGP